MKTILMFYLHSLLFVSLSYGLHVHGPPGPLDVQLGESVMLPCFVDPPPPLEELEVEWKRNDSRMLVHLWQDGESHPESQDQLYHERAHFFTEEIAHGNFSLFIKNVSRTDVGVYKCVVYTHLENAETLIEIKTEYLSVTGGHILSTYAGEDITLNCFVESNVPPADIEELSWKKTDEGMLVMLYQDGEILTESTAHRYSERVEFFSAEERNKGNFSLRLKNVKMEDKGLYMCLAFSGELSANTTVEVQQLGFSMMHIGIFLLSILGFVIGSLILGSLSYTTYRNNDDSRKAKIIQMAHLLCPNITLSIVFILWGVSEGFFDEALTCSAVNLIRIPFLLWIALRLRLFKVNFRRFINYVTIPLQYSVTTVVVYYRFYLDLWYHGNIVEFIIISVLLIVYLLTAAAAGSWKRMPKYSILSIHFVTTLINIIRTVFIIRSGSDLIIILLLLFLLFSFLTSILSCLGKLSSSVNMVVVGEASTNRRLEGGGYLVRFLLKMMMEFVTASFLIYFHYNLLINQEDRDSYTCAAAFLQISTLMILFVCENDLSDITDSMSKSDKTRRPVPNLCVFMLGSVVVVFVNTAALLVELILTSRNGERTVDLRVIVLLTESVLAVSGVALQVSTFWKWRGTEYKAALQKMIKCCGCKRTSIDSPPHADGEEMQTFNPDP